MVFTNDGSPSGTIVSTKSQRLSNINPKKQYDSVNKKIFTVWSKKPTIVDKVSSWLCECVRIVQYATKCAIEMLACWNCNQRELCTVKLENSGYSHGWVLSLNHWKCTISKKMLTLEHNYWWGLTKQVKSNTKRFLQIASTFLLSNFFLLREYLVPFRQAQLKLMMVEAQLSHCSSSTGVFWHTASICKHWSYTIHV